MSREIDSELERELEACRQLAGGPAEAADLAPLRAELEASLAAERGLSAKLRERPTSQRIVLLVTLGLLLIVTAVFVSPRSDLSVYPLGRMVAVLGILGSITIVVAVRLLRPLHRPPPPALADRVLLALAFLAPLAVLVWPLHYEGAPAGEGTAFFTQGAGCFAFGAIFAVPLLLLAGALRRARVDGPAVAALVGVTAGLGAILVLHVHCPVTSPSHVLAGHASLLVILTLAAALWRR